MFFFPDISKVVLKEHAKAFPIFMEKAAERLQQVGHIHDKCHCKFILGVKKEQKTFSAIGLSIYHVYRKDVC